MLGESMFQKLIDTEWEQIKGIIDNEEKYNDFRDKIYNKTTEKTTIFGLENFLHLIIVSFKDDKKEMDLDYLVKVYNPDN